VTDAPQAAAPRRPEGRYGPPRRQVGRRTAVAAGAAAVLGAVGWAAYVSFGPGDPGVAFLDLGAAVVADDRVEVRFEVQKDPDATAVCTVRAVNRGLTEVGRVDVTIGPADRRATTLTAVVPTTERATGGNVKACALR
jgi:hypothetical protein